MKIEYVGVDSIKPYENNAKEHPSEQIKQIAESILEFGFNDPIAVNADGLIIEGHGRYLAAKSLNMEQVPIIRLDMDEEAARAYMLVHNQLTMNTGFDYDILNDELSGIDIDLSDYGFEYDEPEKSYTVTNREINPNDFDDEAFDYECSECGFKFNA